MYLGLFHIRFFEQIVFLHVITYVLAVGSSRKQSSSNSTERAACGGAGAVLIPPVQRTDLTRK